MGEINPLLAEIFSMMEAAGVGEEMAAASPEPERAGEGELAEDAGLVPGVPAANKPAELAGS